MILLKRNIRRIIGDAAYLLLLLLSVQHAMSEEEEGPASRDLLSPPDDVHVETPLVASAAEIARGDIDQAAAAIAAAAASAASAAAEAVGILDVREKDQEETLNEEKLDDGGLEGHKGDEGDALISSSRRSESATTAAALAYHESSTIADIAAAVTSGEHAKGEEEDAVASRPNSEGVKREQDGGDGGLRSTIFPPDDILSESQLGEDAVEGNSENHDSSFVSSSAEDRNGGKVRRFGERWDGLFGGSWKRRNGEGRGQPFKEALRRYDSLLKEHYAEMSFLQATALGAVGDVIAQRLERRWNPGQKFEWRRTAHAGVLNMIIDGIFTPQWYNVVDRVNSNMTFRVALAKALAASTVYGPFANGMFLAGARVLRYGVRTRFDWDAFRRQLMVCTVRDFEMWPPLHVLNFWLVPRHRRPLAGHLVGVALLAVISSTGLTDAGLPLGQRALPLVMRWGRRAADAVAGRARAKTLSVSGAPAAAAA